MKVRFVDSFVILKYLIVYCRITYCIRVDMSYIRVFFLSKMDLYGTIYIDNIKKTVVICLIIPTTFPFDLNPGWTTYVIHPGIFFMLDPTSKGNIVGMIRQMTTAF